LIDIIIGLGIIGFGLNMAFDNSAFLFLSWMPIIFYVPFKNRITVPRIGYVKFSASNTKLYIAVAVLLLIFLLGILFFLFAGQDNSSPQLITWFRQYYLVLLGGLAAICFAGAGLLTGITRLYAYAGLIMLIFTAGTFLDLLPPFFVLLTGLLIEAVGVGLLIRFIRKYPLIPGEGTYES
jgi:hypothetical protein